MFWRLARSALYHAKKYMKKYTKKKYMRASIHPQRDVSIRSLSHHKFTSGIESVAPGQRL